MLERDDNSLVLECLKGDIGAFAELVDRYQKPLFNTALRMVGDYEEARDITQDVFLKTYNNLAKYQPKYKFFSWVYRILVNESINCLKKRKNHQELNEDMMATGRTPDQEYEANVLSAKMEEALRELTFDARVVIVLRHFNDMGYQEMSDVLSIPAKTVKSRLYSARKNLAGILERRGVETW